MTFAEKCQELNQTCACRADCCGATPFERQFIVENYISITLQEKYTLKPIPDSNVVLPMTEDSKCIFLDRNTYSCNIYEKRPVICRQFGDESSRWLFCPHMDATGKGRIRQQRRNLQRKLKAVFDSYIKQAERLGGKQ